MPIDSSWLFSAKVTEVRFSQKENASSPMAVTLAGMVILVRLLQSENA